MAEDQDTQEEVLQTRIVFPKEVSKEWKLWVEALETEVRSLIEEKMG